MNTKLPQRLLIRTFANQHIHRLSHQLTLSFLFFLCSFSSFSQQYDWDWAVSGGGYSADNIYDVKVGSDNNYYFIATMKAKNGVQLNGQPVTVYNQSLSSAGGSSDIFLFSTTCDGTIRWSQAIGGGIDDTAYNLVLDSNDNVYIGAYVRNKATTDGQPVHFSPTDSIPYPVPNSADPYGLIPQEGYKTLYLAKYNNSGMFQDKKNLQGDVGLIDGRDSQILDLAIDSQNRLHFIVGLPQGIHLDNQVTVPQQYSWDPNTNTNGGLQYHLAVFDSSLNYVNSMVLPITAGSSFPRHDEIRFVYDEILNRYYLAGMRSGNITAPPNPLTYDGYAFVERSFILAVNGINSNGAVDGSEVWRREIYSDPINGDPLGFNTINSLVIDSNSDVYIGGYLYKLFNTQPIKIYDATDTNVSPYLFTPGTNGNIPIIAKLNSSGTVQWVQATAAHASTASQTGTRRGKGLAIRGNEVAFGAQGGADFWDTIEIVRPPVNHQPDPILIRFNKQTGTVKQVHDILGTPISIKRMATVAVDNDGNYITAGHFNATLFDYNANVNQLVVSGQSDFFVAKLAASVCGTPVSTAKFNTLNVNVYPNPTTDIVYFETEEKLSTYMVFNQNAQQVKVQTQIIENNYQMSLGGLASGTYFVLIKTESGKSTTVKVVKE